MSEPQKPYPQEFYPGCPCYRCDSPTWLEIVPGIRAERMSLCPQCGNKAWRDEVGAQCRETRILLTRFRFTIKNGFTLAPNQEEL